MSVERAKECDFNEKVPKLKRLIMQLTARCNSNCYFCMNGGTKEDLVPFRTEEYKSVIELLTSGIKENVALESISFTGGEPLIVKDLLLDIAEFNKDHGLKTMLVSNAIFMTPELAKRLYERGVAMARVSMDTYKESVYDEIRGTHNGFKRAIQGIKYMLDAGIKVIIRCTITQRTIDDVVKTYQLCNDIGVSEFQLRVVSPYGRSDVKYMPTKDQIVKVFNDTFAVEDEVPIETPCFMFAPCTGIQVKNRMKACPCAREWAYVKINGDMYPCNYFPEETRIGNFYSDDIDTLWATNKYLDKIRNHIPEQCKGCNDWDKCYNQCQGLVYTLTGDFEKTCFNAVEDILNYSEQETGKGVE